MPTPKETAAKIAADVDSLMTNHRRVVKVLLDAMAPNVKQRDRDELRRIFTPYTQEASSEKKPNMERGGAALE